MKFCIDAGHGGTQTGAIGNGIIEKNINLFVVLEVKRLLEAYGQEVFMTRLTDTEVALQERCDISNHSNVDRFISIHHNANNGKTTGAEIYHSVNGGEGKVLAEIMAKEFEKLGRKVKVLARESETTPNTDYYYVIKHTNAPAIISEFAYIDSLDYINVDTASELILEANAIVNSCLSLVGLDLNSPRTTINHWAKPHFDYLVSRGITINEKRFDDKMTRGECFALLAQIYANLSK
jgi:N-acetylmuramoyl-L-alanine amidase